MLLVKKQMKIPYHRFYLDFTQPGHSVEHKSMAPTDAQCEAKKIIR